MRIHEQVVELKSKVAIYEDGLRNMYEYVCSDKFHGFENHGVNVSDIISRIEEIETNLIARLENESEGIR